MCDNPFHDRQRNLVREVEPQGCRAVLVCSASALRWLCGFAGSNGALLITEAGSLFFTDGRYETEAHRLLAGGVVQEIGRVSQGLPAAVFGMPLFEGTMRRLSEGTGLVARVALEADHVTVSGLEAVQRAIAESACAVEIRMLPGLTNALRAIKEESERDVMTRALRLTESVFLEVLSLVREGVSERDLAAEIDFRQRKMGASRSSFETIVAFGRNTARPHARPGPDRLAPGTPILFDFGCELDGYCSDMTRMAFFGKPPADFLHVWSVVNAARQTAVEAAVAGMSTRALDEMARRVIESEGFGEQFVHSLGHGVGMDVHEWPTVSSRTDHTLRAQMVVTIEPGIYMDGKFGVRLEDTVVIRDDHSERLNRLSAETVIL